MQKTFFLLLLAVIGLSSCVSTKKYEELNAQFQEKEQQLVDCKANLMKCESTKDAHLSKIDFLNEQIDAHKQNISQLQEALDKCVNMNQQGNVNIGKLLDEINVANAYIRQLTEINRKKDSMNLALSNKIKRSLDNLDDEDVNVKVLKGVVFVSLSDKMLFKSGSYVISDRAGEVLNKLTTILNDYKDYDILIEGHTDNVPITNACIKDNWDLSAMRSTTIARYFQNNMGINPARITAGARSEYVPKATNDTDEGRSINRRTEVIIMPKLDEFIKLMENAPQTN
jgi:chemotaxis protein MotB